MELIKDTIASLLKEYRAKKDTIKAGDPEELLKKALTKKELGHIKFNTLKKGTLNLNVDSSSWLYALTLKKEELLLNLNKGLNKADEIQDIRFFIGTVKKANQK